MSEKKRPRFRDVVQPGELMERTKQAYEQKDSSGKFQSYVNSSIPLKQWKCLDGSHVIDILPWIASDRNFNGFKYPQAVWKTEVYAHFGIGINENAYVCPTMTIGIKHPCPICEYQAELKKQPGYSEKEYKSLIAKRRVVMQILCYDPPEQGNTVFWWESSHHLSAKKILDIAKSGKGGGYIPFSHPDNGRHICFRKEGTKEKTDYVGFVLEVREPGNEIPDELLDQTVAIEDYIDILSYEELEMAFYGKSSNPKHGITEESDDQFYEEDYQTEVSPPPVRRTVVDEEPPPAPRRRPAETQTEQTEAPVSQTTRRRPAETQTEQTEAPPTRVLRPRRDETPAPAPAPGARTRLPETPPVEERSTRLTRRPRVSEQE